MDKELDEELASILRDAERPYYDCKGGIPKEVISLSTSDGLCTHKVQRSWFTDVGFVALCAIKSGAISNPGFKTMYDSFARRTMDIKRRLTNEEDILMGDSILTHLIDYCKAAHMTNYGKSA